MSNRVSDSEEEELNPPDSLRRSQKFWYMRFGRWYAKNKEEVLPDKLGQCQSLYKAEVLYLNFLWAFDEEHRHREDLDLHFLAQTFALEYKLHRRGPFGNVKFVRR